MQEIKSNYNMYPSAFTTPVVSSKIDSAIGTDRGRSCDDDDYHYDEDGNISFDSSDDDAIIYRMKLAAEKRKEKEKEKEKEKTKMTEEETERPIKHPRNLYVAATMAAATQTKSNGDEDNNNNNDSNNNNTNNFNVSLISNGTPAISRKKKGRKRKEITKSKQQTKWMLMYRQLIAYKKEHNTTKVPRNYENLGEWVALQRKLRNNNSLLDGRYSLLDSMNFDWGKGPRPQTGWMDMYKKLLVYKKEHNNTTNVPKNFGSLGLWVHLQRKLDNKNMLLDERYSLLDSINFHWGDGPRPRAHWLHMYQRLIEYKKLHNNTNVPQKYEPDIKLGLWVMRQRNTYSSNKLLDEYYSLLDSIGFVWSLRRARRPKICSNILTSPTSAAVISPLTQKKKLCSLEDTSTIAIATTAVPTSTTSSHTISSSVPVSPSRAPILDDVGIDDNEDDGNTNMQEEDIDDHYHHPYASLYAMATTSDEYLPMPSYSPSSLSASSYQAERF